MEEWHWRRRREAARARGRAKWQIVHPPPHITIDPELYAACSRGDTGAVLALIQSKGWRDGDCHHLTPLIVSVSAGGVDGPGPEHLHLARTLLDRGHAADFATSFTTALLSATGVEHAALLLDRGADIEQECKTGDTPLYVAVLRGRIDLVKLFISRGAAVDHPQHAGVTPLNLACCLKCGRFPTEVVQLLLARGACEHRAHWRDYESSEPSTCIEFARKFWTSTTRTVDLPGHGTVTEKKAFVLVFNLLRPARQRILAYWLPRLRREIFGRRGDRGDHPGSARWAVYDNHDLLRCYLVPMLG